jgi:hypothetical protein
MTRAAGKANAFLQVEGDLDASHQCIADRKEAKCR